MLLNPLRLRPSFSYSISAVFNTASSSLLFLLGILSTQHPKPHTVGLPPAAAATASQSLKAHFLFTNCTCWNFSGLHSGSYSFSFHSLLRGPQPFCSFKWHPYAENSTIYFFSPSLLLIPSSHALLSTWHFKSFKCLQCKVLNKYDWINMIE